MATKQPAVPSFRRCVAESGRNDSKNVTSGSDNIDSCDSPVASSLIACIGRLLKQQSSNRNVTHFRLSFSASLEPSVFRLQFISHPALSQLLSEDDQKVFKHLSELNVEDFKDVKSGYTISFVSRSKPSTFSRRPVLALRPRVLIESSCVAVSILTRLTGFQLGSDPWIVAKRWYWIVRGPRWLRPNIQEAHPILRLQDARP